MKKLFFGVMLLVMAVVVPVPAMAGVNINIGIPLPPLPVIPLPPPIAFGGPPDVVVLPDTDDVYAVPDVDADMFFWNGWWWRSWEGRWYRSHYYNRGWAYFNEVPSFYFDVDPGWRGYYKSHQWDGHRWNYERIPDRRLQQNWKNWHNDKRWESQKNLGVEGYKPQPQERRQDLRRQRQEQYQQRPDVKRHQGESKGQKPEGKDKGHDQGNQGDHGQDRGHDDRDSR